MPIRAGDLNRKVRLQRRALDDRGERRGAWTDTVQSPGLSCSVLYLRGSETVMGQRLEGQQPAVITVRISRATALIDNSYRAVVRGRMGAPDEVFNVKAAEPTKDRDGVDILGVRGGGDA